MGDSLDAGFQKFRELVNLDLGPGKKEFKARIFPDTVVRNAFEGYISRLEGKFDLIEMALAKVSSGNFYPTSINTAVLTDARVREMRSLLDQMEKISEMGSGGDSNQKVMQLYGYMIAAYVLLLANLYITAAYPVLAIYKIREGKGRGLSDEELNNDFATVWGDTMPTRTSLGIGMGLLNKLGKGMKLFGGELSRYQMKSYQRQIEDPLNKGKFITEDTPRPYIDADLDISDSEIGNVRAIVVRMLKGMGSLERLV